MYYGIEVQVDPQKFLSIIMTFFVAFVPKIPHDSLF